MGDLQSEVEKALGVESIAFEEVADEGNSPLNQPVVEHEIGHGKKTDAPKEQTGEEGEEMPDPEEEKAPSIEDDFDQNIYDAPEQEIGEYSDETGEATLEGEDFELPIGHAKQAADTLLGMTDNMLTVGSGFFVKIKKHKNFYDFEEIVQVIDEQNARNVKRLNLDDEDKALLRPLIVAILQKKAKRLTPEQQLLGAILSILMKKAQVVIEIRAENELLLDRILEIIREEKGASEPEIKKEEPMEGNDNLEETVLEVATDEKGE